MNKTIIPIIFGIFLLTFVSANLLDITITNDSALAEFEIDFSNQSYDDQDISFDLIAPFGIEIPQDYIWLENISFPIKISELMSSVDFRVEFNDGEHAPEVTSFDLYGDRFTITLDEPLEFEVSPGVIVPINISDKTIDEVLFLINEMSEMFTLGWAIPSSCSELTNLTQINNLISENIPEYFYMNGNSYVEKSGINYVAGYDNGFGLVPEEYIDEIEEVLLQSVYSYNLQELFAEHFVGYEEHLNYSIDIDLNGLVLEDGYYEVLVYINGVGQIIGVTLEGITIPVVEEDEEDEEEDEDEDSSGGSYKTLEIIEPKIEEPEPITLGEDIPDEPKEEPKEERKINPIVWIIAILLVGIAVVTTLVIVVAKSKVKTTKTFDEIKGKKIEEDDANETT